MKKLFYTMALFVAVSAFVGCGNGVTGAAADADSTAVDTTVVDSAAVDSVVADTAAVDTVVAE